MKVAASVRRIYEDQREINGRLKTVVDDRVRGLKDPRWHYESRLKELPSFALKIESGRFANPEALEDFFACTIVVANAGQIAEAEHLISEEPGGEERRPPQAGRTHKAPD